MTREEHLEWCKKRALEYLDRNDNTQAVTSMLSDLTKHAETKDHIGGTIAVQMMLLPGWLQDTVQVRRWIEGFR